MLALARRVGARFLLASNPEACRDPDVQPQPEDYHGSVNAIGIRDFYDEGKRIAETLCSDYKKMHNEKILVSRFFNTYAPAYCRTVAAW